MLTRKKQLYAVSEPAEGVYTAPSPSGLRLVHDLEIDLDFSDHPRNLVAESMSTEGSDTGREMAKVNFSVDLGGSGTVTTEPLFALFLKACGMRPIRLYSFVPAGAITLGTGSAPFAHGETISNGATDPALGKIVGSYSGTPTKIVYMPLLTSGGTFTASDVVTGLTSGASVTISGADPVAHGYAYLPTSNIVWKGTRDARWSYTGPTYALPEPESTLADASGNKSTILRPLGDNSSTTGDVYLEPIFGTHGTGAIASSIDPFHATNLDTAPTPNGNYSLSMGLILDGILVSLRGARGNWKLNLQTGQPTRMDFEFMAVVHTIVDLPPHTYNDPTITRSLRFQSAQFRLDSTAHRLAQLELDMQNTLAPRDDPSFGHGAMSYRVTGRSPQGRMDPEMNTLAVWDWYSKWRNGDQPASQSDIRARMGTNEDAVGTASHDEGGTVWLDVPKAQLHPVQFGDREGIRTADVTFDARRGDWYGNDEIAFYVI